MRRHALIIKRIKYQVVNEFAINEEQVGILIITNYLSQEIKQKLSVICNNSETIRAYIITSFVFIYNFSFHSLPHFALFGVKLKLISFIYTNTTNIL